MKAGMPLSLPLLFTYLLFIITFLSCISSSHRHLSAALITGFYGKIWYKANLPPLLVNTESNRNTLVLLAKVSVFELFLSEFESVTKQVNSNQVSQMQDP